MKCIKNNSLIKFLQNKNIDKKLWDEIILSSPSSRVYAYSWFLDAVCPNWCALVSNNYQEIMPLPLRKKWGFTYIYPPPFAQQLGVFHNNEALINPVKFIESLPRHIKYLHLKFNDQNFIKPQTNYQIFSNKNFCLSLDNEYEEIIKKYSDNTKRNIKKAVNAGISIMEDFPVKEFIDFSKKNKSANYPKDFTLVLERLIESSFGRGFGQIWAAVDTNGNLHSALFWLKTANRSYYLCPFSNETGKESRAMFLIVDKIIKMLAGQKHILDFEGSNIEGIARFYKGFGAENISYQSLVINRLPWPIKLLKT